MATEEGNGSEIDRVCLVCSDSTRGNHFGIDSCRACAAFFRRSIIKKKFYSCRTGGNCTVDKILRCMCRKCRLQKCLDAGMNLEGVQGNRDPIGPKRHDPIPLEITAAYERNINHVPSTSSFQPLAPCAFPSNPCIFPQLDLINRTLANYRQLCSIRKATELALVPHNLETLITCGPLSGMSLGTSAKLSLFFRAQVSPVTEFVSNTFEEFSILDNDERWTLLQRFLIYIFWMDCCFRAYKKLPREHYTSFSLVSETTYLDANQSDAWVADISDSPEFLKADYSRFIKKEMQSEKLKVLYMMSDMQLRDEEYAALLGLLLFNTTIENSTPNIDRVVRMVRAKIYEEINIYYRNSQEFSNSMRFAELMDLLTNLMVHVLRCKEELEIFSVFDVFKKDDLFYEMVRNI